MEFANETFNVNERLHQEIKMLREGLKISLKNNEQSHKLVQSLENKLNEVKNAHSKQIKELETRIWNYQVKVNKYKEENKRLKIPDDKTCKESYQEFSDNINNYFQVFLSALKTNLEVYDCFKNQIKSVKKFSELIKTQNYCKLLKKILKFSSELILKISAEKISKEAQTCESNTSGTYLQTEKPQDLRNPKRVHDKKHLKSISILQNTQLIKINHELSEIVASFNINSEKEDESRNFTPGPYIKKNI